MNANRRSATPDRPRLRSAIAALAAAFAVALGLSGGCATSNDTNSGAGASGMGSCSADSDCNDDNPCTTDVCNGEGKCDFTVLPDGVSPGEVAGDCQKHTCVGGQEESAPDDGDLPDDGEDCTVDVCSNGVPSNTAKTAGSACTDSLGNEGICKQGVCNVSCSDSEPCPDKGPCVTATCDPGTKTCLFIKITDGTPTPGVQQLDGDCHVQVCLDGVDTKQIDPTDVPKTPSDCDDEICDANGVPQNPPRPLDSPCSTGGGQVCDGDGTCVECTTSTATNCPGVDNECQYRVCIAHVCDIQFQPNGTPTATQVAGDCHTVVCDGTGGTIDAVNDADVPADVNPCTNDICTNGVPSHTNKAAGTICGNMIICDSMGNCSGCTSDNQCMLPNTCGGGGKPNVCGCTKATCAGTGKTCGSISDGCGGMLNCNDGLRNGTESDVDCGGSTTCGVKCSQGKKCATGGDCTSGFCVDGVCCNSTCTGSCQACSASKKGAGIDGACGAIAANTDPDSECTTQPTSTCGTNGFCDGAGACAKYASGTTCATPYCTGNTLNKKDTCNGSGACIDGGIVSCDPFLCSGMACTTSCGVDTDCVTGAYCLGGLCTTQQGLGTPCSTAAECSTAHCVDGVCCDTTCTGACLACSATKKQAGSSGFCGPAKDGSDPHGDCPAAAQATCGNVGGCSGGTCLKWPSGTVCGTSSCSAGVATDAATCNGQGTCAPGNMTPCAPYTCSTTTCNMFCTLNSHCVAGHFCDATNQCAPLVTTGNSCAPILGGADCQSGFCVAGVCCSTACPDQGAASCGTKAACNSGTCEFYTGNNCNQTCNAGANTMTFGTCNGTGSCTGSSTTSCAPYKCGVVACNTSCFNDTDCITGFWCDGKCHPKKPTGTTCVNSNECINGACNAGFCN